jgi:hypothetical protein
MCLEKRYVQFLQIGLRVLSIIGAAVLFCLLFWRCEHKKYLPL